MSFYDLVGELGGAGLAVTYRRWLMGDKKCNCRCHDLLGTDWHCQECEP